ncbi:MAG: tRNA 2-selenouridine(34) synthase MnmH, partial [Plesiomonas shigelloides]
ELLESALVEHQQGQSADVHLRWLEPLLVDYYDPMYQYQLSKKADRIGFTGTYQEVEDFLRSNTAP